MSTNRHSEHIELTIDKLVLHGFAPADRHRIGEAVQQELLRQFSQGGIPPALTRHNNVARLNASFVQAEQGQRSEQIGVQVARAVYGSVGGNQLTGNGTSGLNSAHRRSADQSNERST